MPASRSAVAPAGPDQDRVGVGVATREAGTWALTFAGVAGHVRDSKRMRDIAALPANRACDGVLLDNERPSRPHRLTASWRRPGTGSPPPADRRLLRISPTHRSRLHKCTRSGVHSVGNRCRLPFRDG